MIPVGIRVHQLTRGRGSSDRHRQGRGAGTGRRAMLCRRSWLEY